MEQGWRSGPRLPKIPATPECWRCAEPARTTSNHGRVLRLYALTVEGRHAGTVLLCSPCAGTATPPNPDPLTVEEAA